MATHLFDMWIELFTSRGKKRRYHLFTFLLTLISGIFIFTLLFFFFFVTFIFTLHFFFLMSQLKYDWLILILTKSTPNLSYPDYISDRFWNYLHHRIFLQKPSNQPFTKVYTYFKKKIKISMFWQLRLFSYGKCIKYIWYPKKL